MARGSPAQRRALVRGGCGGPYVHECYFEFTAVAEYELSDAGRYDYSLSPCNAFYRALLAPAWNSAPYPP